MQDFAHAHQDAAGRSYNTCNPFRLLKRLLCHRIDVVALTAAVGPSAGSLTLIIMD